MTKELTVTTGNAIDFSRGDVIATMRETLAKDLTPAEFLLFVEHCKATGLNPFKKEVWPIKAGGRLQVMTGINGFLAIANAHPMFDGMEVEVDSDEKPTKATCKVYRKDRKFPAVGVAMLKEYAKDTPTWRQMPRVMLTKVAKSIAIREAFPHELNGTYTAEEMPPSHSAPEVTIEPLAEEVPATFFYNLSLIGEEHREAAQTLLEGAGGTHVDGDLWSVAKPLKKLARALLNELDATDYLEHLSAGRDNSAP